MGFKNWIKQKNSGNFAKPPKIAQNLPTEGYRIWLNFKIQTEKNRVSIRVQTWACVLTGLILLKLTKKNLPYVSP